MAKQLNGNSLSNRYIFTYYSIKYYFFMGNYKMYADNYLKYIRYKSPDVIAAKYYYSDIQNKKCKYCPYYFRCCASGRIFPLNQISVQKEPMTQIKPQNVTVSEMVSEMVPETTKVYNDTSQEINLIINTNSDSTALANNQELIQGEIIVETQDVVRIDNENDSTIISNNNEHTGEDIKNIDLPLTPENTPCGFLHYRKWWELIEVDISVCGKIITGIPIFAEENTLRVINDNHSYFIPIEKIDYIRTTDGLRSSFNKIACKKDSVKK